MAVQETAHRIIKSTKHDSCQVRPWRRDHTWGTLELPKDVLLAVTSVASGVARDLSLTAETPALLKQIKSSVAMKSGVIIALQKTSIHFAWACVIRPPFV